MTNGDLFNGRKMFDSDNQYLPICLVCCVCVCVCVCVRACVRACVRVRAYVRGCVRARVDDYGEEIYTHKEL